MNTIECVYNRTRSIETRPVCKQNPGSNRYCTPKKFKSARCEQIFAKRVILSLQFIEEKKDTG